MHFFRGHFWLGHCYRDSTKDRRRFGERMIFYFPSPCQCVWTTTRRSGTTSRRTWSSTPRSTGWRRKPWSRSPPPWRCPLSARRTDKTATSGEDDIEKIAITSVVSKITTIAVETGSFPVNVNFVDLNLSRSNGPTDIRYRISQLYSKRFTVLFQTIFVQWWRGGAHVLIVENKIGFVINDKSLIGFL